VCYPPSTSCHIPLTRHLNLAQTTENPSSKKPTAVTKLSARLFTTLKHSKNGVERLGRQSRDVKRLKNDEF
jgi:hypothetical protein